MGIFCRPVTISTSTLIDDGGSDNDEEWNSCKDSSSNKDKDLDLEKEDLKGSFAGRLPTHQLAAVQLTERLDLWTSKNRVKKDTRACEISQAICAGKSTSNIVVGYPT
ncbi:hypothetical protein IFM89_016832 [Coptis chinensis]|uniref:Uncharacterized protein n=1 Tax=Coptis chinensis TaxID=261450 RepID=A0A835GWT6_9MAGN|nr:hypothetical protein IFM89_016832 [Coptis chinensis]